VGFGGASSYAPEQRTEIRADDQRGDAGWHAQADRTNTPPIYTARSKSKIYGLHKSLKSCCERQRR
jgi:hypothetical protein